MEQRKLIRLGNSSYAVALPKKWVEQSGLKKGDHVFVERNSNGEIVVSGQIRKLNNDKKKSFSTDEKDTKQLMKEFIAAYINGCSTFHFVGNINKEKLKDIKKIAQTLMGCEVIEERKDEVVVKDFLNFEEVDPKNFIKRIDNNLNEMFSIILESLKNKTIKKSSLDEIQIIDADINKFFFLSSRLFNLGLENYQLAKVLHLEPKELFKFWWITFHLERAADNLKYIAHRIKKENLSNELVSGVISQIEKLIILYQETFSMAYNNDKNGAQQVMEKSTSLYNTWEKFLESKNLFVSFSAEKLREINSASYQILKIISSM